MREHRCYDVARGANLLGRGTQNAAVRLAQPTERSKTFVAERHVRKQCVDERPEAGASGAGLFYRGSTRSSRRYRRRRRQLPTSRRALVAVMTSMDGRLAALDVRCTAAFHVSDACRDPAAGSLAARPSRSDRRGAGRTASARSMTAPATPGDHHTTVCDGSRRDAMLTRTHRRSRRRIAVRAREHRVLALKRRATCRRAAARAARSRPDTSPR